MSEQRVFGFHNTHISKAMSGPRGHGHVNDPALKEAIVNGQALNVCTDAKVEILGFDTSPVKADGKPAPGNDPEVQSWRRAQGGPIVQWRWGYYDAKGNKVMLTNSGQDKFEFGSADDDGGCTPTLKLDPDPIGPGVYVCFMYPIVEAEDNGGVEVSDEKNEVRFNAD